MERTAVEKQIRELDNLSNSDLEYNRVIPILKNLTELMKSDHFRCEIDTVYWNSLTKAVKQGLCLLAKSHFEVDELDFLTELFRFLRNSCAGSAKNQQYILSSDVIRDYAATGICRFLQSLTEKEILVLRCCLQLYGNLVCCGNNLQYFVWDFFMQDKKFNQLLQHPDAKVQEYAMMVLYNCMVDRCMDSVCNTQDGQRVLIAVTDALCQNFVDWGILFLELLLKQEDFLQKCYEVLPDRSRLLLLDLVTEQLSSQDGHSLVPLPQVVFVKDRFLEMVMNIVKVCTSQVPDAKAVEIVKMLSLLCAASISQDHSAALRNCPKLLETSIDVLRSVHLLGREAGNSFTPISSLRNQYEVELHPSFCFKKNLVRLTGNLCYGCRSNQDALRKLDGIPLLLDCCNLDARNPFILQWCVLALRNVLEQNAENCAVLAGITVTGDLVESKLIREMGFRVRRNADEKFVLEPLQR